MTELVLCVRDDARELDCIWTDKLDDRNGSCELVETAPVWFIPRPHAESDPTFRQIVPYVLLENEGSYASYQRIAGDHRLLGQYAVGLGGHVNTSDIEHKPDGSLDVCATIDSGRDRELDEEIDGIEPDEAIISRQGVILSNFGEIERVHIGLIEIISISHRDVFLKEDSKKRLSWLTPEDLSSLPLEHWSRLCVQWLRGKP